ncbi:MAG: response regulator [Desulfobulbaceae bacterium]|nr:response regulator [Desulfobulbaceae bacterium]
MDREELIFLVVEDNAMMMKIMLPMLEHLGYKNIVTATNGLEAWRILNGEDPIHIVLSDLIMPKMAGIELLHKIRTSERLWDLPFVMVTGEENQNQLMSSIEVEVDAYILKPYTQDKLGTEITRILNQNYKPSPFHLSLKGGRTLLTKGGDKNAAIEAFKEASRLKPNEADPYYFWAVTLDRGGNPDEAKTLLEKCISLNEAYPKAYDLLGQIYHREEDYTAERQILNRISELSPHNLERNLALALACVRVGDQDGARKHLKFASRHADSADLATFERIFRIFLEDKDMLAEAEVTYRKYIDKSMSNPRLLNKFALLFKGVKDFERTIFFLEKIVTIWRTVKNHGIPMEDMAIYYFNLSVAKVEQAKTFAEPEKKKAGYQEAEKLVNKAMDCNIQHQGAAKLEHWLEERLK